MQTTQETALGNYAQLMLEHQPVGTALFLAPDLRLLAANPCYQSFLAQEWQGGRAIGHRLSELLPRGEHTDILRRFGEVIQTGVATHVEEYVYPDSEGVMRYWTWSLSPISEQKQVSYVLLTLVDVTAQVVARRAAEQVRMELTKSHESIARDQQRLQYVETILSSMSCVSEPRAFADALLQALQTCFAPQAMALYSNSSEQKTLSLLASRTPSMVLNQALFPIHLAQSSRPSLVVEATKARTPLIKRLSAESRNGQEGWWALPALQWAICVPLWTQQCEGVLLIAFAGEKQSHELVVDTLLACAPRLAEALAQTRLHAQIADERERLHTVLDQLPEGVILVEARTGKIRSANRAAAQMLGLTQPHLVGAPLNHSAFLSPYGHSKTFQQSVFRWNFALIDALWGKTVTNQEMVIKRPDGSDIVVLSSAAPIRTSHGFISEAVMVFQDISALKELEQQKSEFFAVANHELRTPLTVIIGFAELLHLYLPQGSDTFYHNAISSLTRECEHLSQLLGELLDVSRLEQAQLDLTKRYQEVLAPLGQLVNQHMQASKIHQLHLTLEDLSASDTLMGWVDLRRMEQVLRNLLSNAMKYSPAGGVIQVGVRPRRDAEGRVEEVLIWVADQGMGIAAHDLPHIFERFYRAERSGGSISGFGIGLYLSKQLVQAHGGRIWVESTVGSGSTFFFTLPLIDPL